MHQNEKKKLIILGAGGASEEVRWYAAHQYELIAYAIDRAYIRSDLHCGIPVLSLEDAALAARDREIYFSVSVGNPNLAVELYWRMRERMIGMGSDQRMRLATVIAPNAMIAPSAQIGLGCVVAIGVSVMPGASLGGCSKINVGAVIGHDTQIGSWTIVSPGAMIMGNAWIGSHCDIGTGTIILPRVRIGHGSIVGAGAVVTKDVAEGTTVIGIPAKAIS